VAGAQAADTMAAGAAGNANQKCDSTAEIEYEKNRERVCDSCLKVTGSELYQKVSIFFLKMNDSLCVLPFKKKIES
jgi:hypothetical protein